MSHYIWRRSSVTCCNPECRSCYCHDDRTTENEGYRAWKAGQASGRAEERERIITIVRSRGGAGLAARIASMIDEP